MNEPYCYVCVFLCEYVAIIKISFSIKLVAFHARGWADPPAAENLHFSATLRISGRKPRS